MGFLSGVLSNIKDHLGQHKDKIEPVIKVLEQNKHRGKEGFNDAIGKVAQRVREYNERVIKSNNKVSDKLNNFTGELMLFREASDKILREQDDSRRKITYKDHQVEEAVTQIDAKLREFQQKAEQFTSDIDTTVADNELRKSIVELNDKLRDKLENVSVTIKYESGRLETVRGQEAKTLQSTEQSIKATIGGIQVNVNCKIDVQVKEFISKLKNKVTEISQMLQEVEKKLREHIYHLEQWINKAEAAVKAAFKQIEKILEYVNERSTFNKVSSIYEAADGLKKHANMLYDAGEEAKKKVAETVKTALNAVKDMDEALKGDLKKVKDAVNVQVEYIKTAIGKLYKVVESGKADEAIDGDKEIKKVVERIREKLKEVTGGSARPTKGLGGIKDRGVSGYGYLYNGGFGVTVQGWIADIFKHNAVVTKYIEAYIQMNESEEAGQYFNELFVEKKTSRLRDSQITTIASVIKQQLDIAVPKAQVADGHDNVQENLNSVYECITKFVQALKEKIEAEDITSTGNANSVVGKIVGAIEGKVRRNPQRLIQNHRGFSVNNKICLEFAVKDVLCALLSKARQAAEELHNFALNTNRVNNKSIAQTIDTALTEAKQLEKYLGTAVTTVGRHPDHAAAVDSAIKGVTTTLEEEIGTSDTDKITKLPESKFQGYRVFVDQNEGKLTALTKPDFETIKQAGTLPAAIGGIREQVQIALSNIDTFSGQFAMKYADVTNDLNNLCSAIQYAAELDPASAKTELTKLKDEYFKDYSRSVRDADSSIKKIKHDLGELHNNLVKNPIAKVTDLLLFIEQAQKHYIHELQQYLNTQVEDAKTRLTTHARKTYVDSIKFLLTEFAGKVTRELAELPGAIDADLEIGFKGFMKYFHDPLDAFSTRERDTVNKLSYALKLLCGPLQLSLEREINRVDDDENRRRNRAPTESESLYVKKLKSSFGAVNELLMHLADKNGYDRDTHGKLDNLEAAIAGLKPETFAKPNTGILHSIAAGLTKFVSEMRSVYISAYDSEVFTKDLMYREDVASTDGPKTTITLTQYGKNCSKVFLSILPMVAELMRINEMCMDSKLSKKTIFKSGQKNPVAAFFKDNGYDVPSSDVKQEGYMRCGLTALAIADKLSKDGKLCKYIGKREGTLNDLLGHLHNYYYVCHYATFSAKKHPSSIYDMLCWLTGLSHNPVHHELTLNGFSGLFEKPKETDDNAPNDGIELQIQVDGSKGVGPSVKLEDDYALEAYPTKITATGLAVTLTDVCHYAEETLIAILGRGHSGGRYVCDFNTNVDGFVYPSDGSKCLDLLAEILLRLFHQLSFLYKQCTYPTQLGGWLDCHYGRDVGGSNWICDTMQCPNQQGGQTHNQTCDQKCKQTPKCGLKSPLQSFLEDGLPGFMPHPYGKSDCKMKCDAPNHFGKPCKTPMGFADLTNLASINGTGKRIKDALHQLCGKGISPLTKLCGDLLCLLQRPPQTLGDMFAFYYRFIYGWGGDGRQHRLDAFNDAIAKAHFEVPYNELDVHSIFNSTHSSKSAGHTKGDLLSLVCSTVSNEKCGLYLSSISNDISGVYSSKHADKYLSWMVYITETFYDLLKKLFDDCNKHCGGDKPRCRIAKCPLRCTANIQATKFNHADSCNSIANCKTTLPTLCRYGFTISNPSKLSGKNDVLQKRTCNDFCKMLGNVVKEGNALHTLAYKIIPEFLFAIRQPFIWLNVALWSLSLFYLICVMVGRLDVLHIRSHLRIPSSHRITAQSLLAAAQVGRLAKISYLQP